MPSRRLESGGPFWGCKAFAFQGALFSEAQFKNKLEPPDQFVMGVSDTNTCCQKTGDEA